jgi:predicted AAA+ superfamily ATPase
LANLEGLIILDEIQRAPELFEALRVLVDRPACRAKFLILGSASPRLIKHSAETLAGRIEFVELVGFDLSEVEKADRLWLRGGFPRSYLAASDQDSLAWREGFIRTFLERDIPMLGLKIDPNAMRRFWSMLAHSHGQTWNGSQLGRSMGLSDKTVRSYLDLLTSTYVIRQLQPWHENLSKRQVKAPKIYFRDSGLLHSLLNIPDRHTLEGHPRLGASWEGFALEQVLQSIRPPQAYFWATHSGAKVDLLLLTDGRRIGVEFKHAQAPKVTRSMRAAMNDLSLDQLWVVSRAGDSCPLSENITVCPLDHIPAMYQALSLRPSKKTALKPSTGSSA